MSYTAKLTKLRDLTSKIGSGATPLGGAASYKSTGIPLIRSMNVYDLYFERTDLAFIDEGQAAYLDNVELRRGDVLLNITGASVARCCDLPDEFAGGRVNQHVSILRPIPQLLEGKFLSRLLVSRPYKELLLSIARAGATREALTKTTLEDFEIALPPLAIQRRIADILSAYDDLIEVNTRRIAILEEMAQRLFNEWFNKWRSRGQSNADPRTERGWAMGEVQDVIVLQRGFDLPAKERTPGPYPVIAATGAHGTHVDAKVKGPGIVTGRSGSLGKVIHIEGDFWPLNTTLWGKEFSLGSTYYAYFVLSNLDLKGQNGGAAVPTLNRNDVHKMPVLIPPRHMVQAFDAHVEPLFRLKQRLAEANAALCNSRDLLLPKLISGEIDLAEAARDTGRTIRQVAAA